MNWSRLAIVVVLILGMWMHFMSDALDRNAVSLGALWARVDSLEAQAEVD